jgi:hypothetical protein
MATVLAIGAMGMASAQTVFTYSATDHKTFIMSEAGTTSIPVSTLVIIAGDPNAPRPQVPTRTFQVRIKPPQADEPLMLQSSVDNQVVTVTILRSTIDGEMEALVEIPLSAGPNPELKIFWNTKTAGALEMTLHPTPMERKLSSMRTGFRHRGPVAM